MCLIWWCITITECQSCDTIFAIVACGTTTADWMVEELFIFLSLIRLFFEDTLLSHRCTHSHIPIKQKRINNRKCGSYTTVKHTTKLEKISRNLNNFHDYL